MRLGAFSISLNVIDLKKSHAFYEKLGFRVIGGVLDQNWLIMKNGDAVIGLFEGVIDANILTFNPGFNQEGKAHDPFEDVRQIHRKLREEGIDHQAIIHKPEGPAHLKLVDPDGNHILIDQHR